MKYVVVHLESDENRSSAFVKGSDVVELSVNLGATLCLVFNDAFAFRKKNIKKLLGSTRAHSLLQR